MQSAATGGMMPENIQPPETMSEANTTPENRPVPPVAAAASCCADLLPCPYCRGKAGFHRRQVFVEHLYTLTHIECSVCHARTSDDYSDETAAMKWNRRDGFNCIWQATMIQGLLGFDASTRPEQVIERVQQLLSHND